MAETIQEIIGEFRKTLTDYIEATYHVGDPNLVEQRKRLLEEIGGIFQMPYLESTPRYVAGAAYQNMEGLPEAAKEAFVRFSDATSGKPVLFNPPYKHQAEAIIQSLAYKKNLMIMTGTGSGKTESFLLPILGKFAIEAREHPERFRQYNAVRAIVLYPMNALVNDQLGRLRLLFGDPRVVKLFESWAGRPARFARYTSRTPYAGLRSTDKDSNRLHSIEDFFVDIEEAAQRHAVGQPQNPEEDALAFSLHQKLTKRGKWPAKPSISDWYGNPGSLWRDRAGNYRRAIMGPHDAELITRHEVQESPPDLLITNYSMLEYMMMRPIERPVFDRTRAWLTACPDEKIMVVLDEAHLYRGAQGAEVGLLLRRLRERLGIGPDRFQIICATASFSEAGRANAGQFGAQLAGVPPESFVPIVGTLALREPAATGTEQDIEALAQVNLDKFYLDNEADRKESVQAFLNYRAQRGGETLASDLIAALSNYPPFNLLVNESMKAAVPLAELGGVLFPGAPKDRANLALTALLALGSRARKAADEPSLLPCRIHSFYRGLPGLWSCMDPDCTELVETERGGPTGKLFSQPHDRCACGAPVLEYFTCRYCGTSYARAYTNDINRPRLLWAEPGNVMQSDGGIISAYQPLDLLLEEPSAPQRGLPAEYDLRSGMLNNAHQGDRRRTVYLHPNIGNLAVAGGGNVQGAQPGLFVPCGCCRKQYIFGQTSVQDHQTKGDQPFQALLGTQIRVQPPGLTGATEFAPLRGRKVLVFSDSRQVAARLAPTLQTYSLRDTVRALLPVGFKLLAQDQNIGNQIVLDNAFLAVVVAAHRFGVRVRPELGNGEDMPHITDTPIGQVPTGGELFRLLNHPCPANLMRSITDILSHKELGLESLAVASIREKPQLTAQIQTLPDLPGVATTPETKVAVARAWLRCWLRGPGIWFNLMPPPWWTVRVTTHQGAFEDMNNVLLTPQARRQFKSAWLARLLAHFTQQTNDGGRRLLASNLALEIGGMWRRCPTCKSVHRPIQTLTTCIDCEAPGVEDFDPESDPVFVARRGFYRAPVQQALTCDDPTIMSLIAAEHTAQLNAAQPEAAFSNAEKHELRFQDINIAWRVTDAPETAIDVLSSTTTMEVGIDIGELSGVALRNMPPGRANYQQRAGRAGRRGNAVATVVAFGSSDSHDDHYFVSPDEMIRGPVSDPRLTLENPDIARRHLRAYLLQRYHEARLPDIDPHADPNLFSVLGKVHDFRNGTGILNRQDFKDWLAENRLELEASANGWLPEELSPQDRALLISAMCADVVGEVDAAIDFIGSDDAAEIETPEPEAEDEEHADGDGDADDEDDEDIDLVDPAGDKLLDRLLYKGVLPRYAFPTDVAPFYVFNRALSTPFRPKMEFAPSQGLNLALSQYAPNKQIWIMNKQYTSKVIYSPYRNERRDSWGKRRLYFECEHCRHAKTEPYDETRRGARIQCEACNRQNSFGPAKTWFRPPGFAHPIDREPVTTPDTPNETAYATRAKLVMPTPTPDSDWLMVGDRVRAFPTRKHLLVSNAGPDEQGYHYCVACGRIEAVSDPNPDTNLYQPHSWPFPTDEAGPCQGRTSRGVVLGTDFITDIALFSLPLDAPFRVRPGNDETATALRTVCEAVAKAACQILQIESGEILAEYRPALTEAGAQGLEAEIFIYDTLSGGAGFSVLLAGRGEELFARALEILSNCPANCDASCYRCIRSFRNKLDHRILDRFIGEQFLRHVLYGGYPPYSIARTKSSLDILCADLKRQFSNVYEIERDASASFEGKEVTVPILLRHYTSRQEIWVTLSSPLAAEVPTDNELARIQKNGESPNIICVNDLIIRRHLPEAVRSAIQ
jgi:ATP-dependent helicase YprA (DUF1998 family)